MGQNLKKFQAAPKPLQFTAVAGAPSFAEVRAAIAKQMSALLGSAWGVEAIIRIEWENRMQNRKAKSLRQPRVFEVWKEYEAIAMHFNELLIQLRTRVLGGIAVITALVSLLSKGETASDFRWGVLSAVLVILALVWTAIWILDVKYYSRLLDGAVYAVLEVEAISASQATVNSIQMSHRVKEAADGRQLGSEKKRVLTNPIAWFYAIIFVSLLVGVYISFDQHCSQIAGNWPQQTYGICRVLPYSNPTEQAHGLN